MRRPYTDAGAVLSRCGRYRYVLWRDWGGLFDADNPRTALWVMANPSTADAAADDPTIRRVVGFSDAAGCTRAEIVNWCAYRATDPAALREAHRRGTEVAGPKNDATIAAALQRGPALVIAAWGAITKPSPMPAPIRDAWETGGMSALGLTSAGAPRHPLYVARTTSLRLVSELRGRLAAGKDGP